MGSADWRSHLNIVTFASLFTVIMSHRYFFCGLSAHVVFSVFIVFSILFQDFTNVMKFAYRLGNDAFI